MANGQEKKSEKLVKMICNSPQNSYQTLVWSDLDFKTKNKKNAWDPHKIHTLIGAFSLTGNEMGHTLVPSKLYQAICPQHWALKNGRSQKKLVFYKKCFYLKRKHFLTSLIQKWKKAS